MNTFIFHHLQHASISRRLSRAIIPARATLNASKIVVRPCVAPKNPFIRSFSSKKEVHHLVGQPIPSTHPHLFSSSEEVTPGITLREYAERRKKFMSKLPAYDGNIALIVPGYPERMMSNDIPWAFRQYTNFLYMTGFLEPQGILVLEKQFNQDKIECTMFVRPRDPSRELWDGPRSGTEGAQKIFGADKSFPFSDFKEHITGILSRNPVIFYIPKVNDEVDNVLIDHPHTRNNRILDATGIFSRTRLIKSESEINVMRKSGKIAAESMTEVMRATKPGDKEYQLSALMEYHCKMRGAQRFSYPPVVAGGINANTLHYIANDMILKDGDLVLMDAGCELDGYASDITRAWPVNGKFTQGQLDIYNLVLETNEICIKLCTTENNYNLFDLNKIAEQHMANGLYKLGILKNKNDSISRFYPHFIGHYLGMDTHDVKEISSGHRFEPGLVTTIEPGLYIPADHDIPEKYHGIGIRIEDNVVITKGAPEVLTSAVPKRPEDIEKVMSK